MIENDRPGRPLVIGLGARERGDDGVGPDVITDLRSRSGLGADLADDPGDLSRLLDLWERRDLVVVVDAVHVGAPPGTIHRWKVPGPQPFPRTSTFSTHAISLADAFDLGKALERMPRLVVVLGVEVASTDPGTERSPAVRSALPEVRKRVIEEIGAGRRRATLDPGRGTHHA